MSMVLDRSLIACLLLSRIKLESSLQETFSFPALVANNPS